MEICPICDKEIRVGACFAGGSADYAEQFEYKCEHCGATLDVEVTAEPVFGITAKEHLDA